MRCLSIATLSLMLAVSPCSGHTTGVLIDGTRVILPAGQGDATLRLHNDSDSPALVESWIDRGDLHVAPEKLEVPFQITPLIFRLAPHDHQKLRIAYDASEMLLSDRESLFWLNILALSPKPAAGEVTGKLLPPIRSRLKLFYRPDNLTYDPSSAPGKLGFQTIMAAGELKLRVHNPTPYYITLHSLRLVSDHKTYPASTGMLAPMSDTELTISSLHQLPITAITVRFTTINDYGAATTFVATASP